MLVTREIMQRIAFLRAIGFEVFSSLRRRIVEFSLEGSFQRVAVNTTVHFIVNKGADMQISRHRNGQMIRVQEPAMRGGIRADGFGRCGAQGVHGIDPRESRAMPAHKPSEIAQILEVTQGFSAA